MRNLMVLVWVAAACSGSNPVSIDEYDARSRDSLCGFLAKCGITEDVAACLAALGPDPLSATVRAGVQAGRIKYDGGLARACFDAHVARSCDISSASYRGYPEECLAIFQGTLHDGATCATSAECISQNCESPACTMACCTGTCAGDAAPVLPKIGESCATIPYCEAEAYCDTASQMCMALKGAGASCKEAFSCADGLLCTHSKCAPSAESGQPCAGMFCRERGQVCSETTQTCVNVGLLGDPCNPGICGLLYTCGADNRCSTGLALGAPCVQFDRCSGLGAFCDIPDGATTGMCTLPKPTGASCHDKSDCASQVCDPASSRCVEDMACD